MLLGGLGKGVGGLLFTPLMLSLDGLSGIKGCCLCHPNPSSGRCSQHLGDLILLLIWVSPVPHCSQTLELGDKGGYVRGWQLQTPLGSAGLWATGVWPPACAPTPDKCQGQRLKALGWGIEHPQCTQHSPACCTGVQREGRVQSLLPGWFWWLCAGEAGIQPCRPCAK